MRSSNYLKLTPITLLLFPSVCAADTIWQTFFVKPSCWAPSCWIAPVLVILVSLAVEYPAVRYVVQRTAKGVFAITLLVNFVSFVAGLFIQTPFTFRSTPPPLPPLIWQILVAIISNLLIEIVVLRFFSSRAFLWRSILAIASVNLVTVVLALMAIQWGWVG